MLKNNALYTIIYFSSIFLIRMLRLLRQIAFDRHFSKQYNFKGIKIYKNKHRGEKCFIVATAPSLTFDDLQLIKKYKSFTVNSMAKSLNKTDWRPTYYGVQDSGVEKVKEDIIIHRCEFEQLFIGVSESSLTPNIECDSVHYILNPLDHNRRGIKHILKAGNKADIFIYDGFSITYSMIELAMYMGFVEIILLGVDCDYSMKQKHFVEYTDNVVPDASINMYQAYQVLDKFAKKKGVKIMNASRGWKLDVFECVSLEDVI